MQAAMIAGSIRSRKSRVAGPSANNRYCQRLNSQSVHEDTATSRPDSLQPFENEKLPDSEVVRRARAGDAGVFEDLYRSHCKRVYAVCLRMVGNTTDAEDLTQEAFMLLFRKIHTFRGE